MSAARRFAGVSQPSVFRGRVLSSHATLCGLFRGVNRQICPFREMLLQQAICILIRSPPPRRRGVAGEHRDPSLDLELLMLGKLRVLVPCEWLPQILWEPDHGV